jgi:hypothetical protein
MFDAELRQDVCGGRGRCGFWGDAEVSLRGRGASGEDGAKLAIGTAVEDWESGPRRSSPLQSRTIVPEKLAGPVNHIAS